MAFDTMAGPSTPNVTPLGSTEVALAANPAAANFIGTTWQTQTLTWSFATVNFKEGTVITPFSGFIADTIQQAAIRLALQDWSMASGFQFVESTDTPLVDIRFGWGNFPSLVNNPGDLVQYGVTFDDHFSPDMLVQLEDPQFQPISGTSAANLSYVNLDTTVYQLALQTIGLAIGLDFNGDPTSVMYASLAAGGTVLGTPNRTLSADDGQGGIFLFQTACFAEGTRINTDSGDIAVEALRPGDSVKVLLHVPGQPVVWIGHRTVNCRDHPNPEEVRPIRIAPGALGQGRPFSALYLSPDHAVFVGDVLIPIKYLIDGSSIVQIPVDAISYYHVALPHHDLLLAEGMPVESYLSTGREFSDFAGPRDVRLLWDSAKYGLNAADLWDANACAPIVICGTKLQSVRDSLRESNAASRTSIMAA